MGLKNFFLNIWPFTIFGPAHEAPAPSPPPTKKNQQQKKQTKNPNNPAKMFTLHRNQTTYMDFYFSVTIRCYETK